MREGLVLVHGVVQQAMDLGHAGFHERSDAGGRDAAQALHRGGEAEQVVRGGEEEEEEQDEGEEGEQDTASGPHPRAAPFHSGGRAADERGGRRRGQGRDAGAVFGRGRSGAGARAGVGEIVAAAQHRGLLLHENGGR